MTQTISEYAGQLVVERCWCGIQHAVPQSLVDEQRRQFNDGQTQMGIYCPLGHSWQFNGKGEADRLKEELTRKENQLIASRANHDQTRAELRETERRRRAEKGAKTKLKKRIANGVCPCCNRYFERLHKHIAHMHPDYVTPEEVAEPAE